MKILLGTVGVLALSTISVSAEPSMKDFFISLQSNDFVQAEQMLREGVDINKHYRGDTALTHVINQWNTPAVNFLLDHNANVNVVNNHLDSALHLAIYKELGDGIVERMLEAGARPTSVREEMIEPHVWTPEIVESMAGRLVQIASEDSYRVATNPTIFSRCLEERGPRCREFIKVYNSLPMNERTRAGFVTLLETGKLPQARRFVLSNGGMESKDSDGRSPVHLFSTSDKFLPVMKLFIELGADINSTTDSGSSPLSIALRKRAIKLANFLLDSGASVDNVDSAGKTPLEYAEKLQDQDLIDLIQAQMQSLRI